MKSRRLMHTVLLTAAGAVSAQAESMIERQSLKATPSTVTVGAAMIEKPGYVVIHESKDGKPGPIIGHERIEAGTSEDVTITLEDEAQSGQELIVMLHSEGDGDEKLDAKDPPVMSGGKIVMETVTVE